MHRFFLGKAILLVCVFAPASAIGAKLIPHPDWAFLADGIYWGWLWGWFAYAVYTATVTILARRNKKGGDDE